MRIIPERLAQIGHLKKGSHGPSSHEMCAMEAVAYVAGEPWSAAPKCACPVITAFMVTWNDSLPNDAERDRLLKGLILEIVGTRSTKSVEMRRATLAADWLIRTHTPAWLRRAKLETQAALLESLPEITDFAQCSVLMNVLHAVRIDANSAKVAAGGAAVGDAVVTAGDAAWEAARVSAKVAVGDAAWDVAWVAARVAAEVAAKVAAVEALKSTTSQLQISAVALIRKMIAVKEGNNL